ncbi:MAG: hypothetical protein OEQ39_27275 [Gammaproteobacteria bacterium]|nr:hypothetical protein [Gammaproteobacteria bacterium]
MILLAKDLNKNKCTEAHSDETISKCLAINILFNLWAGCQARQTDTPAWSDESLAAVCGFEGDPVALTEMLIKNGWIEKCDEGYRAVGFLKRQCQLVARWDNGKKGGRPKKNGRMNDDSTLEQKQHAIATTDASTQHPHNPNKKRYETLRELWEKYNFENIPAIHGLTYEMFVQTSRSWFEEMSDSNFNDACKDASKAATLWTGRISQPGLWFNKQLQSWWAMNKQRVLEMKKSKKNIILPGSQSW